MLVWKARIEWWMSARSGWLSYPHPQDGPDKEPWTEMIHVHGGSPNRRQPYPSWECDFDPATHVVGSIIRLLGEKHSIDASMRPRRPYHESPEFELVMIDLFP